jgi:hypothetical protein
MISSFTNLLKNSLNTWSVLIGTFLRSYVTFHKEYVPHLSSASFLPWTIVFDLTFHRTIFWGTYFSCNENLCPDYSVPVKRKNRCLQQCCGSIVNFFGSAQTLYLIPAPHPALGYLLQHSFFKLKISFFFVSRSHHFIKKFIFNKTDR